MVQRTTTATLNLSRVLGGLGAQAQRLVTALDNAPAVFEAANNRVANSRVDMAISEFYTRQAQMRRWPRRTSGNLESALRSAMNPGPLRTVDASGYRLFPAAGLDQVVNYGGFPYWRAVEYGAPGMTYRRLFIFGKGGSSVFRSTSDPNRGLAISHIPGGYEFLGAVADYDAAHRMQDVETAINADARFAGIQVRLR